MYSTVFFVDGNPHGYRLVLQQNGKILIQPAETENSTQNLPSLSATNTDGTWKVEGTSNQSLIDQVVEELSLNKNFLDGNISAAP